MHWTIKTISDCWVTELKD